MSISNFQILSRNKMFPRDNRQFKNYIQKATKKSSTVYSASNLLNTVNKEKYIKEKNIQAYKLKAFNHSSSIDLNKNNKKFHKKSLNKSINNPRNSSINNNSSNLIKYMNQIIKTPDQFNKQNIINVIEKTTINYFINTMNISNKSMKNVETSIYNNKKSKPKNKTINLKLNNKQNILKHFAEKKFMNLNIKKNIKNKNNINKSKSYITNNNIINQNNQINQINQINKTNQNNQTNQINKTNQNIQNVRNIQNFHNTQNLQNIQNIQNNSKDSKIEELKNENEKLKKKIEEENNNQKIYKEKINDLKNTYRALKKRKNKLKNDKRIYSKTLEKLLGVLELLEENGLDLNELIDFYDSDDEDDKSDNDNASIKKNTCQNFKHNKDIGNDNIEENSNMSYGILDIHDEFFGSKLPTQQINKIPKLKFH